MKPKIGDVLIFLIVLSASFIMLSSLMEKEESSDAIAQIIKDGEVIRTINLNETNEPIEIEIKGKYINKIIAEKGSIRFEESDCPDRTCELIGPINRPGQTAACVPAGVIIKIVGTVTDDTDIILR